MATLARLFDFQPSTPIVSGDVDAEFNQLVNILNGTSTSKNAIIKYSDAGVPPLQLDQLGAGDIARFSQSGIVKSSVTNNGSFNTSNQFISTLATGTKPIDVASTTLCTNLNADLLDGLDSTAFQPIDSDLTALANNSTNGLWARTGAGTGAARTITGTANQITVTNGDGVAGNPTLATPQDIHTGASPTFANLTITGAPTGFWKHLVTDTTSNTATGAAMTSFTVPAGTLSSNGSRLRFEAGGTGMNNGETVSVKFAGVDIGFISQGDTATTVWLVSVMIIRLSATSVRCLVRNTREHINYNDGAVGETRTFNSDITVNNLDSLTNVFECVATGTITQNALLGEVMKI